ncbi:MAG: sulfurtransferase TusA family protein [Candidatus Omnitrophota bacterium]
MKKVASSIDAVGLFCPLPVVKLKLELEKIELNGILELLADDPGVLDDLPAWCKETGNRLLSIAKNKDDIFVAYIQKKTPACRQAVKNHERRTSV